MRCLSAIFFFSFRQFVRHRILYLCVLFALLFFGVSLVLSDLAVMQKERVIVDLGLAGIEVFLLFIVLFFAVQMFGEDQSSGFLTLVFAHPISPSNYIWGRFLGLIAAAFVALLMLALSFFILLSLQAVLMTSGQMLAILGSFLKIVILAALAIFLSFLFSSPGIAYLVTLVVYILGHLPSQLNFVYAHQGTAGVKLFIKGFFYLIPNLERLNFKDWLQVPHLSLPSLFLFALLHTFIFTGLYLTASVLLFSRKDL